MAAATQWTAASFCAAACFPPGVRLAINDAGVIRKPYVPFVRDLIRDRIAHEQWDTGSTVLGTLTVIYNHHQRGLTETLVDLQHHCGETVLASTHIHLTHELCAEMIMLKGNGSGINALANAIKRQRGVLHAALAISTTGEALA